MHATEFLRDKSDINGIAVVALFGAERHLKLECLRKLPGNEEDDSSELSRVPGKDAQLSDVVAELRTVSMFGDRRVVLIEDADDFVKENRPALENYVTSPARSSLLILEVQTWQKTTRLYKALEADGMNIECTRLTGSALLKWLRQTAREEYEKTLAPESAEMIVQLAGDSMGMLRQELAKLAALAGDDPEISMQNVTAAVGGWRTQTTWEMLDALRDGHTATALENLNRLMRAGEAPLKILGGVTFVWRKLAEATEKARQSRDLRGALKSSGLFPSAIGPSEAYLRRIGYARASRLFQYLAEADHNMKGGSRVDPSIELERLFIQLSGAV